MSLPLSAALAITLGAVAVTAMHQFLERRVKGKLTHIHTNDTLFDKQKYGHILNYDRYSLILHGQPTLILSGEFHYWRLPDQSRWRPILEQYRSAGLNCIRIYFHWGFHSPQQGLYDFEKGTNRDIDYLLTLCEELGLYVLAAPGPYICAETQAGGFPIWLAAKREIRLRHMKTNFWKEYDPLFMEYCVEYLQHILPIIAKHQITNAADIDTDPKAVINKANSGCVIGLQIENEAFQHVFGYPIGLHDDMRMLAKTARDCRITVPLFTNDGFEQGSFIVKDDPSRKKNDFGIDLYGFDKYVVFTPNSEPSSWVFGRDPSFLQEWDPAIVVSELDKMEKKVRGFGHANNRSPIFIPELQGGWFNHYGIQYTYDAIYRFYGDQYTRLMLDTVFSQGSTMLNFYMFYGGTNWGTLGDSDVYTSYDYSASIREYGLMSGRLRKLRQGILFLQSFSDIMVRTDPALTGSFISTFSIRSSLDNTICQQRLSQASSHQGHVRLIFMRNFSKEKQDRFYLELVRRSAPPAQRKKSKEDGIVARLWCCLAYKASYIALANYTTVVNPDIHLILSATPIVIRAFASNGKKEVWIAALAASGPTEMAFSSSVAMREAGGLFPSGLGPDEGIKLQGPPGDTTIAVLSVPEGPKSAHVTLAGSKKHDSSESLLHIIFLDQTVLSTLYCYYDNRHSETAASNRAAPAAAATAPLGDQQASQLQNVKKGPTTPMLVTWGSYNTIYNPQHKTLTVESTDSQNELYVLLFDHEQQQQQYQSSWSSPDVLSASSESVSIHGTGLPLQLFKLRENQTATLTRKLATEYIHQHSRLDVGISLKGWETRTTDFNQYDWKDCPRKSPKSDLFQKVSLDFLFTSGHIVYKGTFKTRQKRSNEGTSLLSSFNNTKTPVSLKINMRNRAIVFVNGVCIGSHMTYSRQLISPGAKMGYDPIAFGSHTLLITQEALQAAKAQVPTSSGDNNNHDHQHYHEQKHEIIIVIDSFGQSRQPFVVNDIRNPRGLLSARVYGKDVVKGSEVWQVAGVDVTQIDMAYSSTGFPDEHSSKGWKGVTTTADSKKQPLRVIPNNGVSWWRTRFEGPPSSSSPSPSSSSTTGDPSYTINIPLCCRIEGEFSGMIILNGVLVGRYFGSDSPQHDFYLMDGLVHKAESGKLNELTIVMYGDKETVIGNTNDFNRSNDNNNIRITVLPWIVEDAQGELGQWSGNTAFMLDTEEAQQLKAGPFWTLKQTINI
ncbi:hypothetical protein BX616_002947 [Lobosporangium transversale]|uniref:Glycoside hydrolase superfamily n=1 Tax=Lobosporangium transversale TaxID=64571 RepID=A0A1Y2GVF0_9FUNG|nr:glycoside hydrolase superfamily [Lobosporangium transversale]KAF9899577.1 hypothetical protein BX616_002947 [Lobosporangium transversale]ORZ26257.1 glycoside hydrolase superfamily [Lobosporangium transversale]|eukprot:XP_021884022.1 glycoside hydrolase superfamily [Lobosporangium transversale]